MVYERVIYIFCVIGTESVFRLKCVSERQKDAG